MITISVDFQGRKSRVSVKPGAEVCEALEKAGINRETVIVRLGGEIVPDNEPLREGDRIEALRIISGG